MTSQGTLSSLFLHILLKSKKAKVNNVQKLISSSPQVVYTKDSEGKLPIHIACYGNYDLDVISVLVDAYPDGLNTKDHENMVPLLYILDRFSTNTINTEVVIYLIKRCPESVRVMNMSSMLPIHLACRRCDSVDVVRLLVNLYPESVSIQDDYNYIPLHHACENTKTKDIALYLLSIYPEGASALDIYNNSPIYTVCANTGDIDVMKALIGHYPECVNQNIRPGWLPIHAACSEFGSIESILYLATTYPEGLKVLDDNEGLPLHIVCKRPEVSSVVPLLVDLYPESLKIKNSRNELPIHIACEYSTSSAINYMAIKYPDSLLISGGINYFQLPLHIALKRSYRLEKSSIEWINIQEIVRVFSRLRPECVYVKKTVNSSGTISSSLDLSPKVGVYDNTPQRIVYRMLLNTASNTVSDPHIKETYLEMNWALRKPVIFVILKLCSSQSR